MEREDPAAAGALIKFSPRREILMLPQELLAKILGSLNPFSISKARLACRAFRAASVQCLASLALSFFTDIMLRRGAHEAHMKQSVLASHLQVFTSISDLSLTIRLPSNAEVLQLPAALPLLCELDMSLVSHAEGTPCDCLSAYTPGLVAATRLSSLTLHINRGVKFPEGGIQLAAVLGACRYLEDLTLELRDGDDLLQLAEAVAQEAPRLRSLRTTGEPPPKEAALFWRTVLRSFPHLSRLQSLEGVVLDEWLDTAQVESLSQLLCFRSSCLNYGHLPGCVWELSGLTALQVLRLEGTFHTTNLVSLVKDMTKLRRLELALWDADVAEMDSLLAACPAITALELDIPFRGFRFPDIFARNGFSALRAPSITVFSNGHIACDIDGVLRFSSTLTGLSSLSADCDNRCCQKLLAYLPPMPALTHLRVKSIVRPSTRKLSRPSARFLAGLPRLRRLQLENVLDVERWDDDVKYLAALTELRVLVLKAGESAAECHDSISAVQFRPLTTLWQLDQVVASMPFLLPCCKELVQGLKTARRLKGLPPTDFMMLTSCCCSCDFCSASNS
eukprot:jgi/Botrbrau1/18270/Bobra.0179s0004.1